MRNSAKPLQLMPGGASRSAPETRFARELPTVPPLAFRRGEGRGRCAFALGFRVAKRVKLSGGSLCRLHCPGALDPAR